MPISGPTAAEIATHSKLTILVQQARTLFGQKPSAGDAVKDVEATVKFIVSAFQPRRNPPDSNRRLHRKLGYKPLNTPTQSTIGTNFSSRFSHCCVDSRKTPHSPKKQTPKRSRCSTTPCHTLLLRTSVQIRLGPCRGLRQTHPRPPAALLRLPHLGLQARRLPQVPLHSHRHRARPPARLRHVLLPHALHGHSVRQTEAGTTLGCPRWGRVAGHMRGTCRATNLCRRTNSLTLARCSTRF